MFQTAVGNGSEDPPVGSDLIDSATAEAAAYEPEIWAVLLFAFALITISLVSLRKLESHFFAKPAPQTIHPLYRIEDLLIIFGLMIFSGAGAVIWLRSLFDNMAVDIAGSATISILMMALTIKVHQKRCREQKRLDESFFGTGSGALKSIGIASLTLLCYLPAHIGVSALWDSLLRMIEFDNDMQHGIVLIQQAIQQQNWGLLLAMAVTVIVIAPCTEEVLFRGLLFRYLRDRNGFIPAALISSMLFGLLHDSSSGPVAVLGFLLAWLYQRSGNLWLSILLHSMFNTVMISLLFLTEFFGWSS
ncbi:MAG TPA: CPBP family intramembrane metalloprotease [Planctomycetes bacterium]|nr:CPBP family intramembrane metalloprotease [Planctomycetota bacterium]